VWLIAANPCDRADRKRWLRIQRNGDRIKRHRIPFELADCRKYDRFGRHGPCVSNRTRLPQCNDQQEIGDRSPQGLPIVEAFIEGGIDRRRGEEASERGLGERAQRDRKDGFFDYKGDELPW
jgi:hypothetical protein